ACVGHAAASTAGLPGHAPARLLVGDQRERAPVNTHAVAVLALDVRDADRRVVAPGTEIVREHVEPHGSDHSPLKTVGCATSVFSACSAVSTILRRSAFSSSGGNSTLPS